MFHMEQQKMEKEEESSTWNKQEARKNHLDGEVALVYFLLLSKSHMIS